MSSDKYCCVPGCKDSGGMHAVLHGFPNPDKDRLRFNTWLYSIGRDILGLENAHIFKFRRVCRRHFQDKYLCRNNRISNIAVPTLYLPGLNLVSQPKLPGFGRNPLQGLENQPIPSTSTAPELHHQLMYTSTSNVESTMQKENIDPETVEREQVPPSTSQSPKQNLGRKTTARTLKLSMAEKNLQMKIMAAKRRINRLKNKNRRKAVHIII